MKNKKSKREAYESLILLLLIISLFVTATYAWFTDTAFSSGNKIFAGNLYVDTLASEQEIIDMYKQELIDDGVDFSQDETELHNAVKEKLTDPDGQFKLKYYERQLLDGTFEYYYVTTNTDAGNVNLYNVEPGQVYNVALKYKNSGDLALKASGAIKIDLDTDDKPKSYTGLETLFKQKDGNAGIYKNKYSITDETENIIDVQDIYEANHDPEIDDYYEIVYENTETTDTELDYDYRFKKLINMQAQKDTNNSPKVYKEGDEGFDSTNPVFKTIDDTNYYKDEGGRLEDVLEVYIGVDPTNLNNTDNRKVFTDRESDEHKKHFFGTIKQFEYMTTNGPSALSTFEYKDAEGNPIYTYNTIEGKLYKGTTEIPLVEATIEEQYMYLYEDANVNLYEDYNRYLSNTSGYCLPLDTIKNEDGLLPTEGVTVNLKDKDDDGNEYTYSKELVSEMDVCNFVVYAPEDMSSIYQNASISLSLGVTATQVEFEKDGTDYNLYDRTLNDYSHEWIYICFEEYHSNYLEEEEPSPAVCVDLYLPVIEEGYDISFDIGDGNVEDQFVEFVNSTHHLDRTHKLFIINGEQVSMNDLTDPSLGVRPDHDAVDGVDWVFSGWIINRTGNDIKFVAHYEPSNS